MPFKFFKKPWEKQLCTFELQEYGVGGGKGWSDITEPTGEVITKEEAKEYFKPNSHYRVIARAVEGEQGGRFIGVVWTHFEPHRGLKPAEAAEEKRQQKEDKKPKDVEDVLDEYAEKAEKILTPLIKIEETFARIRAGFMPPAPERQSSDDGDTVTIPPLEFDGKAPWMMHPYVVHTIAEEIKGVIDYGATRMEKVFGAGEETAPTEKKTETEEEEPLLPSLESYRQAKPQEVFEEKEITLPTLGETTSPEIKPPESVEIPGLEAIPQEAAQEPEKKDTPKKRKKKDE